MQKNTVFYYTSPRGENPVKEFVNSLDYKQRAKIRRVFLAIEEYGMWALIPHMKKLRGTPLWELRIIGKDNIRVFYVLIRDKVLMLHGFVKKSEKTPKGELEVALKRYHSWLEAMNALDK